MLDALRIRRNDSFRIIDKGVCATLAPAFEDRLAERSSAPIAKLTTENFGVET